MPAVHLARLKSEIDLLARDFSDPAAFCHALHNLLDFYADRTFRPGSMGRQRPLLPKYNAPPLVISLLEEELGQMCRRHPAEALALADVLWKDACLEPRLLAAHFLGQVPLSPPDWVIDRIQTWCKPELETALLVPLLLKGGQRLRTEQPGRWLDLADGWLRHSRENIRLIGIKTLLPLLQDRNYENLPPVYRMLTPVFQHPTRFLQHDLLAILQALADHSQNETLFFLRQMLSRGAPVELVRLVRRSLPFFDAEGQASLHGALASFSQVANVE